MDFSDSELLRKARSGDAAAFEALVRPHLASLRRFVFSFARRWQDADDLTQEALIKAFRSLGSFEGRSALSTWLYVVARGICHDWYRGRLAKAREREDELEEHADEGSAQDDLLERRQTSERLWRAIGRLDAEFRAPLVLFDIEGLSYEQIAHIEQIPIGTVRSRLSRARARLREIVLAEHISLVPPARGTRDERISSHAKEKVLG